MKSLLHVNGMTPAQFIAAYGDVAEHSPWVAEVAEKSRPYASREAMVASFAQAITNAPEATCLALIRAHPDLATKARLTGDSTNEQKGAGLDTLSAGEFAEFTQLNNEYKNKFSFPFIFAVKGATKHQILASFRERVDNTQVQEYATALAQITRIFRFRIEDRVTA